MNTIEFGRRRFLKFTAWGLATVASGAWVPGHTSKGNIMTVNGLIETSGLGSTLIHEHVLVDFIGAREVSPSRYDPDEVFEKALPLLMELKKAGCKTMFECTPAYLGRDVQLLKRLSIASGLNLVTNTGFYGAAGEKYLPRLTEDLTASEIAAIWSGEFHNGIDQTKIKPGFIKSGVDAYPLSARQVKILEAACLTHLNTGLTIAVHTGDGKAAMQELEILQKHKVDPSAWIWVHAQSEKDLSIHQRIAELGGWISWDSVSEDSADDSLRFLQEMKTKNLLNRVMISHDSGWYHVGEKDGGNFRAYNYIHSTFTGKMRGKGFTQQEISMLLEANPAKAFAIRVRRVN